MKYLFDHWGVMTSISRGRRPVLLCLDYDGTLTPIVRTPREAVLDAGVREVLIKLARIPWFRVDIVSGRGLKDIKKMVGVRGLIYAGNHGLEIEGPRVRFESQLIPRLRGVLEQVKNDLKKKLSGLSGVLVEDKGLTLSIHYRLVQKEDLPRIKEIFQEATRFFLVRKKIRITSGKKVFEVRPPLEWDKGKVVPWLLNAQKPILKKGDLYPVYIGDDATDEDAFRALKKKGLGIFVGRPKKSYATYYLKSPQDVRKFLKQVLVLCRGKNA